jgi:small subunit ribosomal protein S6
MATNRHYEIVLIIDPNHSDEAPNMLERFTKFVVEKKGKTHRQEDWGRRSLCYSINRAHKGHYIMLNIECTTKTYQAFMDNIRFNDTIIRKLVIQRKSAIKERSIMMEFKDDKKFKKTRLNFESIDYKALDLLKKHVMETGRIVPARTSGANAKEQRALSNAIKVARTLSLLPYCDRHQ